MSSLQCSTTARARLVRAACRWSLAATSARRYHRTHANSCSNSTELKTRGRRQRADKSLRQYDRRGGRMQLQSFDRPRHDHATMGGAPCRFERPRLGWKDGQKTKTAAPSVTFRCGRAAAERRRWRTDLESSFVRARTGQELCVGGVGRGGIATIAQARKRSEARRAPN